MAAEQAWNPEWIKRPGFGLPVDHNAENDPPNLGPVEAAEKGKTCFRNAITTWAGDLHTLREIAMVGIMNEIMEKPEWDRKVNDEAITAKWKAEALGNDDFTERMWDWCIAELRDKAKSFKETGIVTALEYDSKVLYSDIAIPRQLQDQLNAAVRPLENVPERAKDWHPGSNDQVLDLVHPSLFPLVYGRSRVLPTSKVTLDDCVTYCGLGETVPLPKLDESGRTEEIDTWSKQHPNWSGLFQWLPCEVSLFQKNRVDTTSYINNLHPAEHRGLYRLIEVVIDKSIPLWDLALTSIMNDTQLRVPTECYFIYPQGEERPRDRPTSVDSDGEEISNSESQSSEASWELEEEWKRQTRVLVKPEPKDYPARPERTKYAINPSEAPPERGIGHVMDLRRQFADQGLQVIVKLATIHLTPSKPNYPGGSWHVEGLLNEHICATSLYYYSSQNIGPSHLSFRQDTESEYEAGLAYDQHDFAGFEQLLGIENEGPQVQDLGRVATKEGRLLAFPNVLQHRVPSFALADPSKPGHRKILALFLVDPFQRILSTANVPPQRQDWWARELAKGEADRISALPMEMREMVVSNVQGDFPISLEEAKGFREVLMAERRRQEVQKQENVNTFYFCEH